MGYGVRVEEGEGEGNAKDSRTPMHSLRCSEFERIVFNCRMDMADLLS